jgi:hypothetical protein
MSFAYGSPYPRDADRIFRIGVVLCCRLSRTERWPSCSSFLLCYRQPQPCFTAPVCLATDFSSSTIHLHEKASAVRPRLVDLEWAKHTPVSSVPSLDAWCWSDNGSERFQTAARWRSFKVYTINNLTARKDSDGLHQYAAAMVGFRTVSRLPTAGTTMVRLYRPRAEVLTACGSSRRRQPVN